MDNDLIAAFELVEQLPDNWLVCIIRHLFGGSIEYNVSIDLVDDDGHGIRMLGKASERSLPSAIRKAILDATGGQEEATMASVNDNRDKVGPCTCPPGWIGHHHWTCQRHTRSTDTAYGPTPEQIAAFLNAIAEKEPRHD